MSNTPLTSPMFPNSRPPSRSSNAIRSGTDSILALFEENMKKCEDTNLRNLRDLEARFKEFREHAAMNHASIALKTQEVEAELHQTKEDLSRTYLDKIEAYAVSKKAEAEAAQVKGHLDALNHSLNAFGMTYFDDLILKHDDKTAEAISQLFESLGLNDKTFPKDVASSTTMCSVVSTFSQYVEFHERSINEWEEKYRALEQERDLAMCVLKSLPNSVAAAPSKPLAAEAPKPGK
ncbi:hypothetical protein BDZ94DRAFT_1247858 [Collybia nuda]|uniref:Uncharacterized protein n=1 Tax=Collybia nuda TaxID=64659 RepID=A0A9P5YFQ7_9AGAR|nr:hypothetical protein BDZ94DRAFT_1247858 [Collybia nuda]